MRSQLIKRYFITGLLIWVPLAITVWVLSVIAGLADNSLRLLPESIHPHTIIGVDIPGAGLVLTLGIVFVTGLLAANFIGQRLVSWWEGLLARIPVVNSIYNSVKQVSDTLFSSSGNAFRKALLIEYPRQGTWTIAFLTGQPGGDVAVHQSSADQGGLRVQSGAFLATASPGRIQSNNLSESSLPATGASGAAGCAGTGRP